MVYKCSICGYEYDEEKEGKPFSELTECPHLQTAAREIQRAGI